MLWPLSAGRLPLSTFRRKTLITLQNAWLEKQSLLISHPHQNACCEEARRDVRLSSQASLHFGSDDSSRATASSLYVLQAPVSAQEERKLFDLLCVGPGKKLLPS